MWRFANKQTVKHWECFHCALHKNLTFLKNSNESTRSTMTVFKMMWVVAGNQYDPSGTIQVDALEIWFVHALMGNWWRWWWWWRREGVGRCEEHQLFHIVRWQQASGRSGSLINSQAFKDPSRLQRASELDWKVLGNCADEQYTYCTRHTHKKHLVLSGSKSYLRSNTVQM